MIDFHTHVFPDKIAAATVAALAKVSATPPHSNGTAEELLSLLTAAGADIAINLPVLTKPTQFESILNYAVALNEREYGNERIISFAGIHPADENIEEHLYRVKAAGIKGVKIHPDYQNTFFDDESYVRIVKTAKELDLVVVTHAGLDAAYVGQPIKCTPKRVLNLLSQVGGYSKLVLAHIGGNDLSSGVLSSLAGEDIYFDTSYSLQCTPRDVFEKIVEKHGASKILFGSDSPWRDIREEADIIKSFDFGVETEEKIFSANAKELLGIQK